MNNSKFYVTSNDQKGGITAGQINIGQQPRILTELVKIDLITKLVSQINKDGEISIIAVFGDHEAFFFATEIKKFLEENGYNVKGVGQAAYGQPIRQVAIISRESNKIELIVGSNC